MPFDKNQQKLKIWMTDQNVIPLRETSRALCGELLTAGAARRLLLVGVICYCT